VVGERRGYSLRLPDQDNGLIFMWLRRSFVVSSTDLVLDGFTYCKMRRAVIVASREER